MELECVGLLSLYGVCGICNILCGGNYARPLRQFCNCISVAHPDLTLLRNAFKEWRVALFYLQNGPAVLPRGFLRCGSGIVATLGASLYGASVGVGNVLRSITYCKYWNLSLNALQVQLRSTLVPYRAGASAKNYSLNVSVQLRRVVKGVNFAIYIQFPEASAYDLGKLGTEVKNDYLLHNLMAVQIFHKNRELSQ